MAAKTSQLEIVDIKCPTCSHDNSSDAQFCGVCGSPLTVATAGGSVIDTIELPMVGFGEAISRGFSNYFTFSGRATRAEYWWWVLFTSLLGLIPLASLVTLIPTIAVTTRRLHDKGKSGWWQIAPIASLVVGLVLSAVIGANLEGVLGMLPRILGWLMLLFSPVSFVLIIVWMIRKGDEEPNKYGPDPRQPYPQQTQDPT